jgi:DNA-binding CsgD family transcriptional regulator
MLRRVDDLAHSLAVLGTTAEALPAFRRAALERLGAAVAFDAGIFHAFSPRVPLETGAILGISPARLVASMPEWDGLAVELGALRERANRDGVATDRDLEGSARARLRQRALAPFGMRVMVMMHLDVRGQVRSGIALFRRTDRPFTRVELDLLSSVRPVLALADSLLVRDTDAPRAAVPVRLVCKDDRLTGRQRQIVEHVALGHTNEQIASALRLSPPTVRNHLAAIFARLGASNRADLVRLAVLLPA